MKILNVHKLAGINNNIILHYKFNGNISLIHAFNYAQKGHIPLNYKISVFYALLNNA